MRHSHVDLVKEGIRIKPPVEGELRRNGTSAHIQIGEGATMESLLAYGFRTMGENRVVFQRPLGCGIDFFVTINVKDLNDIQIDVIDEDFGQPYDYQLYIMESEEPVRVASAVYEKVETELKKLQEAGILQGHVRGNYV